MLFHKGLVDPTTNIHFFPKYRPAGGPFETDWLSIYYKTITRRPPVFSLGLRATVV
jgi:hypothetical protein